jgi:hypothetical protein
MIGLVILFPQMVMVYKSTAPTVDPTTIQIDLPTIESGAPPVIEVPGSEKAGEEAKGAPEKSGDPLQDMLKQQEDDSDKANKALEDAFKVK